MSQRNFVIYSVLVIYRQIDRPTVRTKAARARSGTHECSVEVLRYDPTSTDGAYDTWIHRFGEHSTILGIGLHIIDAQLGLEAGNYRSS
jgi:hypothetical protein